jgi:very-short-patch-repair endonuclease
MKLLDIILEEVELSEAKTNQEWFDHFESKFPNWDYSKAVIYGDGRERRIKNVYCKIHKHKFPEDKSDGITIYNHNQQGTGCYDCSMESKSKKLSQHYKFTDEQWREKLSSIKEYKDKIDFSKTKFSYIEPLKEGPYVSNFKCKIHNKYFDGGLHASQEGIRVSSIRPSKIQNLCPDCKNDDYFNTWAKSEGEWVKIFKSNKKNKNYDYSKCKVYYLPKDGTADYSVIVVNNIYCNVKGLNGKKHGLFAKIDKNLPYDGGVNVNLHMNGQAQCPKCVCENRQKNFITKSIENHEENFLYDKVDFCNNPTIRTISKNGNVNWYRKVLIGCTNHKKPLYFLQQDQSHQSGAGCPICRISKGEKYINSILISKFGDKYKIIQDKVNKEDAEQIGSKRFDFYIPELKVAIEYDGIGHFEPTFGKTDYARNLSYNITFENDNTKNAFIKNKNFNSNGIRLIRVPYTMEFSEINVPLFEAIDNLLPNQIKYLGDYPRRQGRKEAIHPKKIAESKLSLIGVLEQ